MVHEVEDGGEVGEADAVQEDHGLRRGVPPRRALLQHLPEERRARGQHQLVRPETQSCQLCDHLIVICDQMLPVMFRAGEVLFLLILIRDQDRH